MDLGQKKLFLLDLDGTIYLEESLLPGAEEFLAYVREMGGAYRFLTNNSSRGVDAGLEKMHRLGIPAKREEFLTAVDPSLILCTAPEADAPDLARQARSRELPLLFSGEGEIVLETDGADWYVWQNPAQGRSRAEQTAP